MLCELRQKDALCPPIALAERVKLVGADVKINEGVYKIVEGKALEEILLGQPPEIAELTRGISSAGQNCVPFWRC